MKKSTEVMSAVASVVDFMKQQVKLDLQQAVSKGKVELTKDQLGKLCFYVETSIGNSFTRASSQIENAIEK